jgi:serine phosphatase RsbU (regulator of sigma subunit)
LPSVSEIKEVWKNLFIFYQPKDIVSGDFYWFKKINDYEFLIASADCTGHGVPGGFMSMICSGALKDASRISHKPGEILFHANNSVKDSLSQGQIIGGSKDGMEIALLHLNIQTKTIIYAGANRFLWVLKKDAMDIEDIKPTKGSIASTTEYNFTYQEHKFNLSPGDQLYMSTDGFPDQFGGSGNKKYMTKNFKKLIMSISKKDVIEQELILKNTINTWMRDTEQVDDLLVIGIRL